MTTSSTCAYQLQWIHIYLLANPLLSGGIYFYSFEIHTFIGIRSLHIVFRSNPTGDYLLRCNSLGQFAIHRFRREFHILKVPKVSTCCNTEQQQRELKTGLNTTSCDHANHLLFPFHLPFRLGMGCFFYQFVFIYLSFIHLLNRLREVFTYIDDIIICCTCFVLSLNLYSPSFKDHHHTQRVTTGSVFHFR